MAEQYTRDQLRRALRNAHAAGDVAVVNELADRLDNYSAGTVVGGPLPTTPQEILEQDPWYTQLAIGAGETVEELRQGLFGGGGRTRSGQEIPSAVTDQERADLEMSRDTSTGWKTAGKVGADIGLLAVPGTRMARTVSAFPKALAAESALVGGYEAAKIPEQDETRLGNAAEGAAWTAFGGSVLPGAGYLGRKALGPMREGAGELIEQGVKLTPGQAYPRLEPIENAMSYVPGLSGGVRRRQAEALETWNKYVMNEVNPIAEEVGAGAEGFKALQDHFSKVYSNLWNRVTPDNFNTAHMTSMVDELRRAMDEVPVDQRRQARKLLDKMDDSLKKFEDGGGSRLIDEMDDELRNAYAKIEGPSEWLSDLRQTWRNSFPEDAAEILKNIDHWYSQYVVAQRAGSYKDALARGNLFEPGQLIGAVKAKNAERALVRGEGRLQDAAMEGVEILGDMVPGTGLQKAAAQTTLPAVAATALLSPAAAITGGAFRLGAMGPTGRDLLTGAAKTTGLGRAIRMSGDVAKQLDGTIAGPLGAETGPDIVSREEQRRIAEELRRVFSR